MELLALLWVTSSLPKTVINTLNEIGCTGGDLIYLKTLMLQSSKTTKKKTPLVSDTSGVLYILSLELSDDGGRDHSHCHP